MLYAILAAIAIGFGGGWFVAAGIGDVNLTQCELIKEKMLAEHAEESSERMRVAAESTDKAMIYVMNRIIGSEQQAENLKNELKNYTTGRDCLSADARRVLQRASPAKQRMPEGAEGVDPTIAGSANNTGDRNETAASTDVDIAEWIVSASKLYEQCRARIDAIEQWDAGLDESK